MSKATKLKRDKKVFGKDVEESDVTKREDFQVEVVSESSITNTLVLPAINEHERTKDLADIQPFRCGTCTRNFASYKIMKRHLSEYHSIGKSLFQCEVCSFSCRRKFNIQVHTRSKHGANKPNMSVRVHAYDDTINKKQIKSSKNLYMQLHLL